jgi:hypothetical protein
MLFKVGLLLLLAWLPGAFGLYGGSKLVHLPLFAGLLLVLLGVAKAHDAAMSGARRVKPED